MKTPASSLCSLFAGLWLLTSVCTAADPVLSLSKDLTLTDGRVFKEAAIVSQSPASVTVKHAGGLASVPKAALPAELQAKYPVAVQKPEVRSQMPDAEKAARIAVAKQAEKARIARALAAREARAQWLKDNPQPHEVTYRVESKTPSTKVTTATPEGGIKTASIQTDSWGVWEQKFTATDGFSLKLGVDSLTGRYAEAATAILRIDGLEVRRERLEPKSGRLELNWTLGAADYDQPAAVRNGNNGPVTPGEGRITTIRQDPGFIDTREKSAAGD